MQLCWQTSLQMYGILAFNKSWLHLWAMQRPDSSLLCRWLIHICSRQWLAVHACVSTCIILKPFYRGKDCEDRNLPSFCCPLFAYSLLQSKSLLLLPASADGGADMVSLNFNWKVKMLPGLPLNQYILGMVVLIKAAQMCDKENWKVSPSCKLVFLVRTVTSEATE